MKVKTKEQYIEKWYRRIFSSTKKHHDGMFWSRPTKLTHELRFWLNKQKVT